MSVFTNRLNKKHEVGEPCRTPMTAVMTAIPKILLVTLYIAAIAKSIIKPQPSLFKLNINLFLGKVNIGN